MRPESKAKDGQAQFAPAPAKAAVSDEEYRAKYALCKDMEKLIVVRHTEGSHAVLEFLKKGKDGQWKRIFNCAAFVGKNGMGKEREGDEKTPVGDFGLICAFGINENPGAGLPYVQITENIWCCGDTAAYNRIIDLRTLPHNCKGEKMANYVPEYNYGLFPDYNADGADGRGFAVFLHCQGKNDYTSGCIAVDEDSMLKLLCEADTKTGLCIL